MCVIRRGVQEAERSFSLLTWFKPPGRSLDDQVAASSPRDVVASSGDNQQIEFAGQALVASQAASGTKEERHGQAR